MKKQDTQPVMRFQPDAAYGLTAAQVTARQKDELVNTDHTAPTKSVGRIIRDNVCTLFNLIIMLLGVAVLAVGSHKNLLFVGIMICNTLIGIVQELHTKRAIDRLSILSAIKAHCIRDGSPSDVPVEEVVLDDVLEFTRGNQIVADCVLLTGECDVNESLITGESDAVHKSPGDMLLSGSFVINGRCRGRVEHIGKDNYVSHISSGAKKFKKAKSEIMDSLRRIIRIVSIIMIPVGIILFLTQLDIEGTTFSQAVVSTTAALIGMIPEGLVLLTSSVLAVSVIRLSRSNVMVQQLYCIEALARVDVLCLDKTGTLTSGSMELKDVLPLEGADKQEAVDALAAMADAMREDSPSIEAIAAACCRPPQWEAVRVIHFSSEKKWSGIRFAGHGVYVLGAPSFVMRNMPASLRLRVEEEARENRVLLLARGEGDFRGDNLPQVQQPLALVLLQDLIRPDAAETLRYFRDAGVRLKVISGDDPVTVSTIAKRVGLEGAEQYVDAAALSTDEDIAQAVDKYTVFGRVSPQQKKQMVLALQGQKHTVAMTGDGVNDVLALKEADCSIAMASGSDAARNVSHLVLLDSRFSSMPKVVAEGRRSINNLQRSASLFIVKTIYSIVLSLLFLVIQRPYPFVPIQLTLISALTIGLPSFVLALEPNHERIKGKFIRNMILNALPAALTSILHIVMWTLMAPTFGLDQAQTSTMCVVTTAFTGLLLIFTLCRPFNWLRALLCGVIISGLVLSFLFFGWFFSLTALTLRMLLLGGAACFTSLTVFTLLYCLFHSRRPIQEIKKRAAQRRVVK